jgi:monoamine oxidase
LSEIPNTGLAADCDVAIVGAGVAGLTALRTLEQAGVHAQVLEARDRIGGRIFTVRDPRAPHPIELGAVFIHGSAEEVVQVVDEAKLTAYEIAGQRWRTRGEKLVHLDDYWKRLHQVMRHLPSGGKDRSFADFLDQNPGGRSATDARSLARSFVEGFHAANLQLISAKALSNGGSPSEEEPEEQRIMRISDGYAAVPRWLSRGVEHKVFTGNVVESIVWEPGLVEIAVRRARSTGTTNIRARAVIVTVPLGVLLASPDDDGGAIRFTPPITVLDEARSCLAMGFVTRIVVLFDERWWTNKIRSAPKEASFDSLSFLHGESPRFPIWWTLHPAHLPMMVGWQGGPRALSLAGRSHDDVEALAITSLAKNLGVSRQRVASHVEATWMHDWQNDPYSRGAYSYPRVGGANAAKRLSRSIQTTVWLAGEAADAEGRTGTVHGAIGSGKRAAKSVLRLFSPSPERAPAPRR